MSQQALLVLVQQFLQLFGKKPPKDFLETRLMPCTEKDVNFFSFAWLLLYWRRYYDNHPNYAIEYQKVQQQLKAIASTYTLADLLVIEQVLPEQSPEIKIIQQILTQQLKEQGSESVPFCFLQNLVHSPNIDLRKIVESELITQIITMQKEGNIKRGRTLSFLMLLDQVPADSDVARSILSAIYEEYRRNIHGLDWKTCHTLLSLMERVKAQPEELPELLLAEIIDQNLWQRLDCSEQGSLTLLQLLYWWSKSVPGSRFSIYMAELTNIFYQQNRKDHPELIRQLYFDGLFMNSTRSDDQPDEIISWIAATLEREIDFVREVRIGDFPNWLIDIFSWPLRPISSRKEVWSVVQRLESKAKDIILCYQFRHYH